LSLYAERYFAGAGLEQREVAPEEDRSHAAPSVSPSRRHCLDAQRALAQLGCCRAQRLYSAQAPSWPPAWG
jgi:hypothetical protein